MLHDDRVWCVTTVDSAEELARKLCDVTWTCCTAFELDGYLWLNDSFSPDGAQEYAVVNRASWMQVESITYSWCNYDEALAHIRRTLRGEDDLNDFARRVSPTLHLPNDHHRCGHCA